MGDILSSCWTKLKTELGKIMHEMFDALNILQNEPSKSVLFNSSFIGAAVSNASLVL